jgi:hypothetical protein
MNKKILNLSISIVIGIVCIGIFFAFVDLEGLNIHIKNSGYVGAVFSLSGVLLYFTALMYQIKEYQLQVKELTKSVEAQTKSSKTLDEQKELLLEQNTNALIFGMIDSFNKFKERNKIDEVSASLVDHYQNKFSYEWQVLVKKQQLNHSELNIEFASRISNILERTLFMQKGYRVFIKFIQFAYNILYLIDQSSKMVGKNYFTAFFFSQLNTNETIMLYLSNIAGSSMPIYDNLHWGQKETKEIVAFVKSWNSLNVDYSEMDIEILTREFNRLKQNK